MFNDYLEGFTFLEACNKSKKTGEANSILTVINAQKAGMRLELSAKLVKDLCISNTIQIAISNDGKYLLLGTHISEKAQNYSPRVLKKDKPDGKWVLYNSEVVREITSKMKLQFEDTVSATFYGIEYIEQDGRMLAKIWKETEEHEL